MNTRNFVDILQGDCEAELETLLGQLAEQAPILEEAELQHEQSQQSEKDHSLLAVAASERCAALGDQLAKRRSNVFGELIQDKCADSDLVAFAALQSRYTLLSQAVNGYKLINVRAAHREVLAAAIALFGLQEEKFYLEHAAEVLRTTILLKDVISKTGSLNLREENLGTGRSEELLSEALSVGTKKVNTERELARYDEESARLLSNN